MFTRSASCKKAWRAAEDVAMAAFRMEKWGRHGLGPSSRYPSDSKPRFSRQCQRCRVKMVALAIS